jgi:hypothetical protein
MRRRNDLVRFICLILTGHRHIGNQSDISRSLLPLSGPEVVPVDWDPELQSAVGPCRS